MSNVTLTKSHKWTVGVCKQVVTLATAEIHRFAHIAPALP